MSIIIRNISTGEPFGLQQYELRINRRVIVTFEHVREDGLATCLRQAAHAVDANRTEEVSQMLVAIQQMKRPT